MGICFGKDDVEPEPAPARKRIDTAPNTPAPARRRDRHERSQPQAVGGGPRSGTPGGSGAGSLAGTSYTDRRMEEYDEIRNIVETTTHNFIDVGGGKAGALDAKDLEERHRAYGQPGVAGRLDASGMAAFALPPSAWDAGGDAASMAKAVGSAASRAREGADAAEALAAAVADGVAGVAIADRLPLAGLVVPTGSF